ncbi:MAG: iron-sulfur cluster assembly accessory protein [Candidatus Aenigmarchaeota archaeon]|nr:iron-sulfur cluster assembly accessory protein [Candidatus Aenigmarchaeota archaeon]
MTDSIVITKDMTIAEILQAHPASAEVMQSYGLHCFGCHINMFETLEQGCLGHGMSQEIINDMLDDLNKVANDEGHESPESEMPKDMQNLMMTETAAEKLKDLLGKEDKKYFGIRVALKNGSSGYAYSMDFAEQQEKDDKVIEIHGVKLVVDKDSLSMMTGTVIEYVETKEGGGFRFDNPNTTGCARGCK